MKGLFRCDAETNTRDACPIRSLVHPQIDDRVQACLETVDRNWRKMDTADRVLRAGTASVCTSKARAPGFCARVARMNSSKPARSAEATCQRCVRSSDEIPAYNVRSLMARYARERSGHLSFRAATHAPTSR